MSPELQSARIFSRDGDASAAIYFRAAKGSKIIPSAPAVGCYGITVSKNSPMALCIIVQSQITARWLFWRDFCMGKQTEAIVRLFEIEQAIVRLFEIEHFPSPD